MKRLAAAALVLAAVAGGVAVHRSDATPTQTSAAPTWDAVAPVFAAKCAGCHRVGGIAPFAITSPKTAQAFAPSILGQTQRRLMPPWMPAKDSPAYLRQDERILTPEELALIARWVRGGAKLGRARPIAPRTSAQPSSVTLRPSRAYTAKGADDYRCFVLDPKLTQDTFVTAAVVTPQRAKRVHHVILFDAAAANAAEARLLDARSGGKGWTCFGGPGLAETRASADTAASERLGAPQWISAWAPGHATNALPAGTGVRVGAGDVVVMQVHYNAGRGKPQPDRSTVKLTFSNDRSLTPLETYLLPAPVELPCASGKTTGSCSRDVEFQRQVKTYGADAAVISLGLLYLCKQSIPGAIGPTSTCTRTVQRPLRIYGVAGHMHLRGVDIRVELNGRTLLHIPRWSFNWQDAYYLSQPVDANVGDALKVTCRFDTATVKPQRYVLWGEGTADEMCLGVLQVAGR